MGCTKASGRDPVSEVVIYTTRWCPFCVRAKALLDQKGVSYQEIPVDGDPATRQQMAERAGQTSVPQIWIGEQHIGGCDQLYGLERSGGLDPLLASSRCQGHDFDKDGEPAGRRKGPQPGRKQPHNSNLLLSGSIPRIFPSSLR